MPLADIETIVFLMLENRSFDHALGYLATATLPLPVEGLSLDPGWLAAHANGDFAPNPLRADVQQIDDPPHDHASIAIQLGTVAAPMSGFVDSYQRRSPPPSDPSRIMGFYDSTAVPVFDFLARNYAVCDHWFAALPCGTQPNRMMAMSGSSPILDNAELGLPSQPLVYDWLTANKVAWCSYQWGDFLPFFALMTDWLPEMVTSLGFSALGGRGRFRRYSRFREEWLGVDPMPSVIFIEPEYTDGPHAAPNDDHPPSGIAKGQALVADIYATLTANAARWQNTLLVITYDEHGGFYDHVPPLPIPSSPGGVAVGTTGVRVPGFLISPHVAPGIPFSGNLDHTSFLQLLADRFTPGVAYSSEIASRQSQLSTLSAALTQTPPTPVLAPALPVDVSASLAAHLAASPASNGTAQSEGPAKTTGAFGNAAQAMVENHPDILAGPGWEKLAAYSASR